MNAHAPILPDDLSQLSPGELKKLELKIARKHSGMFPWEAVVIEVRDAQDLKGVHQHPTRRMPH
ncbi:MAG: hypothetical protein AAFY42_12445, partial [Pseudomonadota bacterium]